MKTKIFFKELDHNRIVAAIAEAETHTSGEIRVNISHRKIRDPHRAAARQFLKLGMDKTKNRNAVLIFVAPESHKFAIVGDEAVHAKCGHEFWQQVADAMSELFRQRKSTDAIIHGIKTAGKLLAELFPAQPEPENQLPNSIVDSEP